MPSAISGALRAEHEPEPERRGRGEENAGQLDRLRRPPARLEAFARHVTAVAREPHDRERR